MTRKEILDAAEQCVCGGREQDHGKSEDNFKMIAAIWKSYKGVDFTPVDVAMMMVLLKIARAANNPKHIDNYIDIAGYAACAGEVAWNIPGHEVGENGEEKFCV